MVTTFLCASLDDTEQLAAYLATRATAGNCFCLTGDLGAGKSAFARAFIRARAGDGALVVPSPTFPIVQPYEFLDPALYHFDCYRLEGEAELTEIGLEEALESGICLIEWPEVAKRVIGANRIDIGIEIAPNNQTRAISVSGIDVAGIELPTR